MNTRDAMDRLLHAKRSNIRSCGIKPPDKCHACDADREAIERLEADAQALADVRTLDAYAKAQGQRVTPHPFQHPNGTWGVMGILGGMGTEAATPDEARAKAAAWVREQAKGAQVQDTHNGYDDAGEH